MATTDPLQRMPAFLPKLGVTARSGQDGPIRAARSLVLVAPALLVAACGASAARPPVATVTLKNLTYTPASVAVKVGDTVEWVWADGTVPHNIDGASDLGPFDSGSVRTSGTWSFRFTKAGAFTYHCDVHPAMIGTVTVS